jgi:hypothetical protein
MFGRLTWVGGFGAGYVLGARAGRERYDQIAGRVRELWSDPQVREKAGQAQQVVKERAGQAQQVVKEKAGQTQQLVRRNRVGGANGNGAESDSGHVSGAGTESGTTRPSAGSGSPASPAAGSGTS